MVRLGDGNPKIWNDMVEVMESKLKDIEFSGEDITFDWRRPADARRLDRELFEKYGLFKDIILDPRFQYWKQLAEENVDFSPLLGDPLMPVTTAVIILFMLNKRVSNSVMTLSAAFIFNVNPFYVCLVIFVLWYMNKMKKPKGYRSIKRSSVPKDVSTYSPVRYTRTSAAALTAGTYDHVLVGSDLATLYAAALLSRNGHRCCVLQPRGAAPNRVQAEGAPYPVPLRNPVVGKIERYQSLLDTVQVGVVRKADRVTFSPVGTPEDCYTHTVLRIGGSSTTSSSSSKTRCAPGPSTWMLRAGEGSLVADLSSRLYADKAALTVFLKSVVAAQAAVTAYLISKTGPAAAFTPAPTTAPAAGGGLVGAVGKICTLLGGGGGGTAVSATGGAEAGGGEVPAQMVLDSPAMKAEGMGQFMNLSTTSVEL